MLMGVSPQAWLHCFFRNVSGFLKVGGYFIATLSDCSAVSRLLRSRSYHRDGEYVWRVGAGEAWEVERDLLHRDDGGEHGADGHAGLGFVRRGVPLHAGGVWRG